VNENQENGLVGNGKGIGKVRHVKLVKESNEGLGISITVSYLLQAINSKE
jgi:hypothetical protein